MKYLYLFLCLLTSSLGLAQKQTVTYLKSNHQKTLSRDSAVIIQTITDLQPGSNLFGFTEVTTKGQLIRSGKTLKTDYILPDGECTSFYLSGQKLSYITYDHARPKTETFYYPNGVLYLVKEHIFHTADPAKPKEYTTENLIITCNDSTGKALITNGNGWFISNYLNPNPAIKKNPNSSDIYLSPEVYNEDVVEEGKIKNGKRDGVWKGRDNNTNATFTETYQDDKFISGESIDVQKQKHKYTTQMISAEFKGGLGEFYNYLGNTVVYPLSSRAKGSQGKVFITFVVEKDGSLSNIEILRGVDQEINAESIRVIKQSPLWVSGTMRGVPVRQQYTVPISYTLSDK